MKYSVNFENMGAAFAVPAAVVDQHLRLCGVLQLKVLLLLLRQGRAMSDQEIAAFLRQDPADIRMRRSTGRTAACSGPRGTGNMPLPPIRNRRQWLLPQPGKWPGRSPAVL